MKITLLTGRAHVKHTEGGDFREATYRAVRNGLMQAESVLLEPYYAFELMLPEECVGRAMNDIQRMEGTFEPPESQEDGVLLTGTAPVPRCVTTGLRWQPIPRGVDGWCARRMDTRPAIMPRR